MLIFEKKLTRAEYLFRVRHFYTSSFNLNLIASLSKSKKLKRDYCSNLNHNTGVKEILQNSSIGNVNLYIRQAEFDTLSPEFDTQISEFDTQIPEFDTQIPEFDP